MRSLRTLDMVAIIKSVNKFAFSTYFSAVSSTKAIPSEAVMWHPSIQASGLNLLGLFANQICSESARQSIHQSELSSNRFHALASPHNRLKDTFFFLSLPLPECHCQVELKRSWVGFFRSIFLTTCLANYAFISQAN